MDIESRIIEMVRRGQNDRVEYLKNMHKLLLPSHLKRIQQNDKTVLKEIVLPQWLDWDLLFCWANEHKTKETGRECILCNNIAENGIDFNEKYICEECFLKLKNKEWFRAEPNVLNIKKQL